MEKMFKRSVLGAAVALAAVSGSANAAIELAGDAVQVYGQAAGGIIMSNPRGSDSEKTVIADIESRIGFKGTVSFDDFAPNLVWQIESGNANGTAAGAFGMRDTFVGFDFENVGSIKYGRQLVAAYNYVDWPHTNPGLGNVFDWNNDIGAAFEDRADNVIRLDSANFGGFNFQATLSNMSSTTNAIATSIAGSYTQDMFTIHAGYYGQAGHSIDVAAVKPTYVVNPETGVVELIPGTAASIKKVGDIGYFIVGGSVYLGDVTLTAAYKGMENKAGATNLTQDAYSATAQYILDSTYVFKLGYSATTDTDGRAMKLSDGDSAITGRLGYLLPSAYLYLDVRNYDMATVDATTSAIDKMKTTNFHLGAEYYF